MCARPLPPSIGETAAQASPSSKATSSAPSCEQSLWYFLYCLSHAEHCYPLRCTCLSARCGGAIGSIEEAVSSSWHCFFWFMPHAATVTVMGGRAAHMQARSSHGSRAGFAPVSSYARLFIVKGPSREHHGQGHQDQAERRREGERESRNVWGSFCGGRRRRRQRPRRFHTSFHRTHAVRTGQAAAGHLEALSCRLRLHRRL